jgi:hypothetical protein
MSHKIAKSLRAALPAFISLAAADRLPGDPGESGRVAGQIYSLANDARFTEAYFSQPLTTFATGFKDPSDIGATLEFFSPKVEVPGRLFEWKKWNNAEEFYSEADDIRAMGGDFKRVEYTGQDQVGKTLNKGLLVRVDLDQVVQTPGWENRHVARLLRRLQRNELRRALTLLSAAATNTAKTWDTSAGKDPDQDVLTELATSADLSGIMPTRIGYGHTAWNKRKMSHRAQNTPGGYASAAYTAQDAADFLEVDQVLVSKERYQSTAATKAQIVNNLVLMFVAMAGGDQDDPSNIKRFVSPPPNLYGTGEKTISPPQGALNVNVYVNQVTAKLVDISVEHYSNVIMTSTLGVRQFTIS